MATLAFQSTAVRIQEGVQQGLDMLFPPRCVLCQRFGYDLCPACAQLAEPVGDLICARCGRRQSAPIACCAHCQEQGEQPLRLVRAATIHAGPIREGIHNLKYENRPELAIPLARYLVATFAQAPWPHLRTAIDAVIPVPLHAQRLQERGYNQAERLASAFCQRVGLPLRPHWLQRQQATRSQVGLNRTERAQNVAEAFVADRTVYGRTLLLIDDVYTTGATLNECAAAAHAAGAACIYALALAAPDRYDDNTLSLFTR
jgi:ComF family protein